VRRSCGAQRIDDAGLVDVDVALDEPGAGEAALRVVNLRGGAEVLPHGHDAAAVDADVHRGVLARPVREPRVAYQEVHWGSP
jgi:hypothetical protein